MKICMSVYFYASAVCICESLFVCLFVRVFSLFCFCYCIEKTIVTVCSLKCFCLLAHSVRYLQCSDYRYALWTGIRVNYTQCYNVCNCKNEKEEKEILIYNRRWMVKFRPFFLYIFTRIHMSMISCLNGTEVVGNCHDDKLEKRMTVKVTTCKGIYIIYVYIVK